MEETRATELPDGRRLHAPGVEGRRLIAEACFFLEPGESYPDPERHFRLDPIRPIFSHHPEHPENKTPQLPVIDQDGARTLIATDMATVLLLSWRFGLPIAVGQGRQYHAAKVGQR